MNRLPVQGSRAVWYSSIIQTASPKKCSYTHSTHTHTHTHLHTRTQPDTHRRTHTLTHPHARTLWRIRRRCCARSRRPYRAFCGDGAKVRNGRSANQPKGESALVGNVQAASGPGYGAKCVRACVRGREGTAGKAAPPTTRAASLIATSAAPPAAAAGGAGPGCAVRSSGSVLGSASELTLR